MNAKEFVQIKLSCILSNTFRYDDRRYLNIYLLLFFFCCKGTRRVPGVRKIITAETVKMLSLKRPFCLRKSNIISDLQGIGISHIG